MSNIKSIYIVKQENQIKQDHHEDTEFFFWAIKKLYM